MKVFLKELRYLSHYPGILICLWSLAVGGLLGAIFFSFVGCMAPYDGFMWFVALVSLVWAIWASFPPKEE